MGGTWPKWFILKGMQLNAIGKKTFLTIGLGIDLFSIATCKVPNAAVVVPGMSPFISFLVYSYRGLLATECVSDHGKAVCKDINGICVTERDGYYIVSAICLAFGVIFLVAFIIPTARKLQSKFLTFHDDSYANTFL